MWELATSAYYTHTGMRTPESRILVDRGEWGQGTVNILVSIDRFTDFFHNSNNSFHTQIDKISRRCINLAEYSRVTALFSSLGLVVIFEKCKVNDTGIWLRFRQ